MSLGFLLSTEHASQLTPEVVWRNDVEKEIDSVIGQSNSENKDFSQSNPWSWSKHWKTYSHHCTLRLLIKMQPADMMNEIIFIYLI